MDRKNIVHPASELLSLLLSSKLITRLENLYALYAEQNNTEDQRFDYCSYITNSMMMSIVDTTHGPCADVVNHAMNAIVKGIDLSGRVLDTSFQSSCPGHSYSVVPESFREMLVSHIGPWNQEVVVISASGPPNRYAFTGIWENSITVVDAMVTPDRTEEDNMCARASHWRQPNGPVLTRIRPPPNIIRPTGLPSRNLSGYFVVLYAYCFVRNQSLPDRIELVGGDDELIRIAQLLILRLLGNKSDRMSDRMLDQPIVVTRFVHPPTVFSGCPCRCPCVCIFTEQFYLLPLASHLSSVERCHPRLNTPRKSGRPGY
jgi:hypothetical protein